MSTYETTPMRIASRNSAPRWLALGALAAGTFDLAFASTFWAVRADVPVQRIFQSIATGVLGKASYDGGNASAILGGLLHYAIIAAMMLAYWLVARRMPGLVRQWLPYGALYGLWLYVAMNWIVVPLSAAGGGSKPDDPLWLALGVVVHVLIGIACAWCARQTLMRR